MELQTIVIGINTIAIIAVFVYQANRYSALERSLKALNDMLDSIGKYKEIFKPDDIIEGMNKKHKLERENLEATWQKQLDNKLNEQVQGFGKDFIPKVVNEFMTMNKELVEKYGELTQHPIQYIVGNPDFKVNKELRDRFIKANFPKNFDYFVAACDRMLMKPEGKKQ